jgi:hypothetical protein
MRMPPGSGSRPPVAFIAVLAALVLFVLATLQPSSPGGPGIAAPGGADGSQGGSTAAGPVAVGNGVLVGHSYKNDRLAKPLRETPQVAAKPRVDKDEQEPRKVVEPRKVADGGLAGQAVDKAAAQSPQMPSANLNFDGIPFPGVACNCAPPDTDGEVGLTQYVQMVNEGIQVFDKTTGASVLGPITIVTIWSGFGGVCQSNGDGDPVVIYDQIANRWIVSQFAGAGVPTDECVAVSTSADATGTWNRYGFHLGTNFFDYPHLAVWPDAYYMSMNVFNSSGTAFLGPQPFAFDRAAMLAGSPATFVTTGMLSSTDDAMLPADVDGSIMPPAGAPDPFIMSGTLTTQRIYRMHVNFVTPASTTFTLAATLTPPAFTPPCTLTRACVPEPNGDHLDAIGDRPMFRAAYRRFADGHEALVGNQTVCVVNGGNCESPGTAVVSVRWWEINNLTSGAPAIVQAATYQPDATHRWMGSAAMDLQGNIALCYSVSSATVVPGLRCSGRLAGDPLNTLPQGESTMYAGVASQSATSNRWGDYSDVTVDPVDDCTFWYTSEYYPAGSSQFNWRTRVVNFKFPGCTAGPHGTAHFTITQCGGATPVANATVTIDGNNYGQTNATGVLDATLTPGSHNYSVTRPGWTSASGSVSITDQQTTNVNQCLSSGTAHFVVTNCSTAAPLQGATVTVDGNVAGQTNASGVLDVALTPGSHAWQVTRPNYSQTTGNVSVVNATTTNVNTCLAPTCTEVVAFSQNFDGVTAPALPADWTTTIALGSAPVWTTSNSGSPTPVADSAPNSAFVDEPTTPADKYLDSPAISVASSTAQLTFKQRADFESGFDGGVLEIKIGGGPFTDIVSAGGSFVSGGYNGTISTAWGSPISGRQAWTGANGSSAAMATAIVTLPASAAGQPVQLRWRMGSDNGVGSPGWRVDTVSLSDCIPIGTPTPTPTPTPSPTQSPTLPPPTTPPPGPVAQITDSATTCATFSTGTATTLPGLTYTVSHGKVSTITPSTFTYWVRVNAAAGANAFTVGQSITSGNFSTLFKLGTGGNVYTAGCGTGLSPTFSSTSVNNATSGTATVNFSAPSAGTYYIAVSYSSSSIRNRSVPNPTAVAYAFSTTSVASSNAGLSLHQ